ncbi:MAG: class I SAM-dependent methyltransferase [Proteobacteria bacterium]|nr:class I SAM-dependent methyltransferase [Pseudomonadota bacterium]
MNKFESILKCPITQSGLSLLTQEEVNDLNQKIQQGQLRTRDHNLYKNTLKACLKANGHELYYPIIDDIYYLLADCALGADDITWPASVDMKFNVKKFYDEFGWQAQNGVYQDAKDSEDLREVSKEYIERCHQRLNQFLPARGTYLLDVASGPVQYEAYLSYSRHFDYRLCADISILALQEAKKKLGAKGIYVLCDVTNLPFKTDTIDAGVSLHTLYHVPANEQAKAFEEINRVIKPGGSSIIVYSWGSKSLLMNLLMFPQKAFSLLKRKLRVTASQGHTLYFHAHSYQWFCQEIQNKFNTKLYSWRSVNVPFLKWFIHPSLGGRFILKSLYWLEEKAPNLMGRIGAYPLFVSKK